jgi:glycosyltransferase involved in cell wall biosynthesis
MPSADSITVVIPALNEERNLERAVTTAVAAVERRFGEYEVLVFDDGSTDRTGEIAEELTHRFPRVRVFHHDRPRCLGGVLRQGLELARMERFIYVDGKAATTGEALDRILAEQGRADMIIPYASNTQERPPVRRAVSRAYVTLLNVLFGLQIRHYGNSILFRTDQLRSVRIRTDSYAFLAEAVIKLAKTGATFLQIPFTDRFDVEGQRSKAFRWNNVAGVAGFLMWMLWVVYGPGRWNWRLET